MRKSNPKVIFLDGPRQWSQGDDADVLERELRDESIVFDSEISELMAIKKAAELVKEARIEARLTQAELAKRTRSHQPTLSSFENLAAAESPIKGNGPSIGYIVRLLKACGCDLELSKKRDNS